MIYLIWGLFLLSALTVLWFGYNQPPPEGP